MLKPEIKEKWVTALESGEYAQTKKCLNDGTGFCCLGVLTDLYIKETNAGKWIPDASGGFAFTNDLMLNSMQEVFDIIHNAPEDDDFDHPYTEDVTLPNDVAQWAGLSGDQRDLINLNDGLGIESWEVVYDGVEPADSQPFPVIAEFIKTTL